MAERKRQWVWARVGKTQEELTGKAIAVPAGTNVVGKVVFLDYNRGSKGWKGKDEGLLLIEVMDPKMPLIAFALRHRGLIDALKEQYVQEGHEIVITYGGMENYDWTDYESGHLSRRSRHIYRVEGKGESQADRRTGEPTHLGEHVESFLGAYGKPPDPHQQDDLPF